MESYSLICSTIMPKFSSRNYIRSMTTWIYNNNKLCICRIFQRSMPQIIWNCKLMRSIKPTFRNSTSEVTSKWAQVIATRPWQPSIGWDSRRTEMPTNLVMTVLDKAMRFWRTIRRLEDSMVYPMAAMETGLSKMWTRKVGCSALEAVTTHFRRKIRTSHLFPRASMKVDLSIMIAW